MAWALAAGGTRIHYQVFEPVQPTSLPPVVLLQGLGLSGRFWFDVPASLAMHASRPRRVLVPDNRGSGRSDKPRGPYRMRDLADDVQAVLDAEHVEHAVVVGISMGGMVAQHVALRHPERTCGLVLLATTPGLPHGRVPSPRALATLLGAALTRRPSAQFTRLLLSQADLPRAGELLSRWPRALAEDPVHAPSFFAQLAACVLHSTGFSLHRVRCPTVVVSGAEDILIHPVNARRLAARIPGARLELLPGVAHAIPASRGDAVERALEWLEGEGAAGLPAAAGVRVPRS